MRPPPTHSFVNQLIALTLLLLVFSGTLGLGAVWVRQEISGTANRSRALEVKLATTVNDHDVRHLKWLADQLGPDLVDAAILTTGRDAYRRASDNIAVIPIALLGP